MAASVRTQPAVFQPPHQRASLPISVQLAVLEGRIAKVGSLVYEIFPQAVREPLFTTLKYGLGATLLAVPLVGILAPVKITYLALGALTLAVGLVFLICTLKRGSLDELNGRFLNWSAAGEVDNVHFALAAGASLNSRGPGGKTALMEAARSGHLPVIHILLERGANVNETSSDQSTALMYAARGGHTAALEALIAAGATVNLQNASGKTALMLAVEAGHAGAVDVLLRDPANPAAPHRATRRNGIALADRSSRTALEIAAEHGRTEILQTLGRVLRVGEADSQFRLVDDSGALTQSGIYVIDMAAWNGHTATVQALIELSGRAESALMRAITSAAQYGHAETVRTLLEGIDEARQTGYSGEALISAAVNGQIALVRTLLDPRFRVVLNAPSQSDSRVTVMRLAAMSNGEIVEELVAHAGAVNTRDVQRRTILMSAASEGRLDVVHALITAGARVGAVDENGDTALILAAAAGHTDVVNALGQACQNMCFGNYLGDIALDLAARAGHVETVQALIALSPTARNQQRNLSRRAVREAAHYGQTEVVLALVRANPDPQAFGGQALIAAVEAGKTETVQALLEFGVDLDAQRPEDQMTALMVAVERDSRDTVEVLMRRRPFVRGRPINRTLVNSNGQTALELAAENGRTAILESMFRADLTLNLALCDEALFRAVARGNKALVQTLLELGGRVDAENDNGQTVLRYARSIRASHEIMSILDPSYQAGHVGGLDELDSSSGSGSDSGDPE